MKRVKASARNSPPRNRLPSTNDPQVTDLIILEQWLPYQMVVVLDLVSRTLAQTYQEKYGLAPIGWRIIAHLAEHSPLSPKQIGKMAGIDQVRVTRMVDRLVRSGYVKRRTDPADRRYIQLSLTSRGAKVYDVIAPVMRRIEEELLAGLGATEKKEFLRLFHKVFTHANTAFLLPE